MPAARIIPCLDVADGRVVKGVRFADHRDVGDIVDFALRYRDEGADELVFYDITASPDGRSVDTGWIARVSALIDIPFAVAGGIRDRDTAARCLAAGADKISINSPALEGPELIAELAQAFGRQCVVLGIDSRLGDDGRLTVKQYSGSPEATRDSGRETIAWAVEAVRLGAGEIVLNCIDQDGVRQGYDSAQLCALIAAVDVPVIISGGAGEMAHFADAFDAGASGALAASVFHDRRIAIPELKRFLARRGIEVRP
ncbi:imidazole glycerol phosphate synthase subunit HisF [Sphingomonas mesophila]|uniref:imidazole glycerol phosphate synthase subunit HisF n=1 Tax=Sphingomonas mesophila TaxID=2303576 RepID=UPI000E58A045|nr:imidazole glycerol phosphate synthase subunit HisF [Sphingomonas mesophila]